VSEPTTPTTPVDLDLDADRPSTFRLRGEVFRIRHVQIERYGDAVAELDEIEGRDGVSLKEIWAAQADFIAVSLHREDLERYQALRRNEDDSLEPRDLRKLYQWLWEVHTGRPTKSAEASSPGPGSSEASLRDESGSVEVVRPN
jgi:hypothetical protein